MFKRLDLVVLGEILRLVRLEAPCLCARCLLFHTLPYSFDVSTTKMVLELEISVYQEKTDALSGCAIISIMDGFVL